ncbi:hypothetical protein [Krasilnikovia sp. MM14-A1004]
MCPAPTWPAPSRPVPTSRSCGTSPSASRT